MPLVTAEKSMNCDLVVVVLDETAQHLALSEQVLLPDELIQIARSQPRRKWKVALLLEHIDLFRHNRLQNTVRLH